MIAAPTPDALPPAVGRSEPAEAGPVQRPLLAAARHHALLLVQQLEGLASGEPEERRAAWTEQVEAVFDVIHFAEEGVADGDANSCRFSLKKRQSFGLLLRDRRERAGLSRLKLGQAAKLSDSTLKFIETARHPPTRKTLIRLLAVPALGLKWEDMPVREGAPKPQPPKDSAEEETPPDLNCYITPSSDPVRMVMDLGRFLNGAGGHVEQSNAYLDHQSAAAYIAMCQNSPVAVGLRAMIPLAEAAKRIVHTSGLEGLQVIAIGAGDATLEVRLVQNLLEAVPAPSIELCLLDISLPLLSCAYKHATETLTGLPNVHVWGMQCNFHQLPLYSQLFCTTPGLQRRRLYCMLGGTLANLDNEPRFFQHSLLGCGAGDMLLLDMQTARAPADDPDAIKRHDKTWASGVSAAHAAWLSGPIWRHCREVTGVDFHWALDTQCPVPGSYELDAVATVRARGRADRQFSVFRFRRYDPAKLAECLRHLGWDEVGVYPYGGSEQPASLRLYCKRADADGAVAESAIENSELSLERREL